MSQKKTAKSKAKKPQEQSFDAEIDQLLNIVIHSVYSDKEIFLRELISNAADAVEKLRFEAIEHPEWLPEGFEPRITVEVDPDANKLIVSDNGIGMNRQDLMDNLGTIARSGTKHFLEMVTKEDKKADLIGKFGIGFYSVFMVADEVTVTTRRAGEDGSWVWRSSGKSTYQLDEGPKDAAPGTSIEIHLRDEEKEYADKLRAEHIIKSYSAHIPVPIDVKSGDEITQAGEGKALWRKPKSEITEEEHEAFYQEVGGAFDKPASVQHFAFEGVQQFSALLYVPSTPPFDLFDPERASKVKLYVRRVFITDESGILPGYFRFLKGVVDSEDLPLSISREMLQKGQTLAAMRKSLTGRLFTEFERIAKNEPEKWLATWENFGAVLKEGLYEDAERRDKLFAISRFKTSKGDEWRSLADYIADMKEDQKHIYYVTGTPGADLMRSPQIEGFVEKGIEVLLLSDPVDSFWVTSSQGYEGKSFGSVTQGTSDLDETSEEGKDEEDNKKDTPKVEAAITELCDFAAKALGDKVKQVQPSNRLASSPVCLVADNQGLDRNLERILASQPGSGLRRAPVLELNPKHALIKALAKDGGEEDKEALVQCLFDMAMIMDGELPEDRHAFADSMGKIALKSLDKK